jgi:hypothetical protein
MIKILFLAANPQGTAPLRLDEECRAIDQALRLSQYRDQFDIQQHWAVRVTDFQELLLRHRPNIVHFSGHGSKANEIILQNDAGLLQPVSARALERLFSILQDNIRCVVLNACYTQTQAQAIARHIDCVVGMSSAVQDEAAIRFAAAFYQALGYGRDAQTAFDLGCAQLDLENLDEPDLPRLIARQGDAHQVAFEAAGDRDSSNPETGFGFDQRGQRVKNQYYISGDFNLSKKES